MANILNTRIRLKYDTLSNWTNANPNPVLLAGEIAIVAIPTDTASTGHDGTHVTGTTPPQILMKVGNGTSTFNELPFVSGKSADVYSWAKETGLTITKDGSGNVISGIEWDASLNNGKGGIKFTTASVSTSEELAGVHDRLAKIETEIGDKANDYASSRIDLLEQRMTAEESKVDNNTTYTFTEADKGFTVTGTDGSSKTITFAYLTSGELAETLATYYTKSEVETYVGNYTYAKNEIEQKISVVDQKVDAITIPVTSVNTKTGDVVLSAGDIKDGDKTVSAIIGEINEAIVGINGSIKGLSGAFQFKGTVASTDNLPTASVDNAGHVYIVGDLEYVSNGSAWIQLGQAGEFVLKTVYDSHLTDQAALDKSQTDRIKALEDDIAENRATWATITAVEDSATNGNIKVNGTDIQVYDETALSGRVSKNAEDIASLSSTKMDTSVADGKFLLKDNAYNDSAIREDIAGLQAKKVVEYYEAEQPNDDHTPVFIIYCGNSTKVM